MDLFSTASNEMKLYARVAAVAVAAAAAAAHSFFISFFPRLPYILRHTRTEYDAPAFFFFEYVKCSLAIKERLSRRRHLGVVRNERRIRRQLNESTWCENSSDLTQGERFMRRSKRRTSRRRDFERACVKYLLLNKNTFVFCVIFIKRLF